MNIQINGEFYVSKHDINLTKKTLIQVCSIFGFHIPRFCYHDKLSIAGNCRMCLVELSNGIKPVASCAMPYSDNVSLFTDTYTVKKSRESVLEFLLLNHPLDCPICDQGGECDLQDQALMFGNDRGRFYGYKNSVGNKDCGPLVKTIMTRCIHCTRCVRFTKEVAGIEDFGVTGRGSHMEIGTYVNRIMESEISGNVIDLCPVGALTSKAYTFTGRPWELQSTTSIDLMDSMHSHIKVDKRGNDLLRIVPQLNEDINGEWITDAGRFSYDAIKRSRLLNPLLWMGNSYYKPTTGSLSSSKTSSKISFSIIEEYWKKLLLNNNAKKIQLNKTKFYNTNKKLGLGINTLTDNKSLLAIKKFYTRSGLTSICSFSKTFPHNSVDFSSDYKFNSTLKNFTNADSYLLVGFDSRLELPLIHSRLFTESYNKKVFYIGSKINSNLIHGHLGLNVNTLLLIANGLHKSCNTLAFSKQPSILMGASVLHRTESQSIVDLVKTLNNYLSTVQINSETKAIDWNGYNYASFFSNFAGVCEFNITNKYFYANKYSSVKSQEFSSLYTIGESEVKLKSNKDLFFVYQNHHKFDENQNNIEVSLPNISLFEKDGNYINIEGRMQDSNAVLNMNSGAKSDLALFKHLGYLLNVNLGVNTDSDLDNLIKELKGSSTNFLQIDTTLLQTSFKTITNKVSSIYLKSSTWLDSYIVDYYKTNEILKASLFMARASNAKKLTNFLNSK